MEFIVPDKSMPVVEIGGKAANLFRLTRFGMEVNVTINDMKMHRA